MKVEAQKRAFSMMPRNIRRCSSILQTVNAGTPHDVHRHGQRVAIVCTSTRGPATGLAEKILAVSRNVLMLPVVDSTQVHQVDCSKLLELNCLKESDCVSNSDA